MLLLCFHQNLFNLADSEVFLLAQSKPCVVDQKAERRNDISDVAGLQLGLDIRQSLLPFVFCCRVLKLAIGLVSINVRSRVDSASSEGAKEYTGNTSLG